MAEPELVKMDTSVAQLSELTDEIKQKKKRTSQIDELSLSVSNMKNDVATSGGQENLSDPGRREDRCSSRCQIGGF